jgi:hypothetical protein
MEHPLYTGKWGVAQDMNTVYEQYKARMEYHQKMILESGMPLKSEERWKIFAKPSEIAALMVHEIRMPETSEELDNVLIDLLSSHRNDIAQDYFDNLLKRILEVGEALHRIGVDDVSDYSFAMEEGEVERIDAKLTRFKRMSYFDQFVLLENELHITEVHTWQDDSGAETATDDEESVEKERGSQSPVTTRAKRRRTRRRVLMNKGHKLRKLNV